jgi:hypothetical protein
LCKHIILNRFQCQTILSKTFQNIPAHYVIVVIPKQFPIV